MHELHDVAQGRVVAQLERVVALDRVCLADRGEHLGLLDGVDPEVGLEVEVGVEQVGRVAGLLGHDLEHRSVISSSDEGAGTAALGCVGGGGGALGLTEPASAPGAGAGGASASAGGAELGRHGAPPPGSAGGAAQRGRPSAPSAGRPLRSVRVTTSSWGSSWPLTRRIHAVHALAVGDPVGEAELVGTAMATIGHRRPAQQRHADLRAEAGGEPQRVPDRIDAAAREVELAELRVDVAEVRHRRHDPGLERLDGDDVLDADSHRVSGQALGVGDHDAGRRRRRTPGAGRGSRRPRCRRAPACSVSCETNTISGAISSRRTPRALGPADQTLHHLRRCARRRAGCRGRRCSRSPSRAPRRSA